MFKSFFKYILKNLGNYTVPVDIGNITNTNASKSSINNSISSLQIPQNNFLTKNIATPERNRPIPVLNTASIFERFENNTAVNNSLNNEETSKTTECISSNTKKDDNNDDNTILKFPGRNLVAEELSDDKENSSEHVEDEENILIPDEDFFPTLCFFPNLAFSWFL